MGLKSLVLAVFVLCIAGVHSRTLMDDLATHMGRDGSFVKFSTIEDAIETLPFLGLLEEAAKATGIMKSFADPAYEATIFAPYDGAFKDLLKDWGITQEELLSDTATLKELLLYHVLPDVVVTTDSLNAGVLSAETAQGQNLTIFTDIFLVFKRVSVLGSDNERRANVIIADIEAGKSVIHLVDMVLLPELDGTELESYTMASGCGGNMDSDDFLASLMMEDDATEELMLVQAYEADFSEVLSMLSTEGDDNTEGEDELIRIMDVQPDDKAYDNLLDAIFKTPELRTLGILAGIAGLADKLKDENMRATVFAPTNQAFSKLLEELGIPQYELYQDTELLRTIIKYHIVPDETYELEDLEDGDKLETLLKEKLVVDIEGRDVFILGSNNDGLILEANVRAGKAVLHSIDRVLKPSDISDAMVKMQSKKMMVAWQV